MYSGVFGGYRSVIANRMNAEANMSTQLSSIKLDSLEICKNVKHHFLTKFLLFLEK